jgi:glycosyltransferase involved in cell wall biosynthesis
MSAPPPRVLLLGDSLDLGGTEGQFVEIACGLDRSRWDIRVACVRAGGPLRARLETAGLRPWSCGPSSLKSPGLPLAILRIARQLRRDGIRLVHCFGFYSNTVGVPAARLARMAAVIASQRDMGDLRPPLQRRLHSMALRLATHVLVNSEAIAGRLSRTRAARNGRITVVPNGVDVVRFRPSTRAEGGRPSVTIGTLANLRPEKGLRQLLEAAARVARSAPHARFVIWGDGALRSQLDATIQALALTGAVELRGTTRDPDTALRQCDIFVLPSLSEASSNVVLEAMATGLPVVATRVGGMAGLVDDHRTGILVPPGDAPALAQAILTLVEAPALAAEMGARGRARAVAEFGTVRMIERMDAFYCRALGTAHGAPAPLETVQHA